MKSPDRPPPSLEILEGRSLPAALAPTTLTDRAGSGTLRSAILAANADTTADDFTITLRSGTYKLTRKNTAGQENAAAVGDLDVTSTSHKVVITGRGTRGRKMTVIDATALRDRIFHLIGPGVRLELQNLVLKGGRARDDGSDGAGDAQGGAVLNKGGSVTLTNVLVTGNQAVGSRGAVAQGGGIFSEAGSVVLGRNAAGASSLTKNSAIGSNGAATGGSLFSGAENGSAAQGGGLYASGGTVTITAASFVGNLARGGSGAKAHNTASSTGVPIIGGGDGGAGGSGHGGGLYSFGATVNLSLTTFSANRAQAGTGGNSAPAGGAGGDGGLAGGGGVFTDGGLTVSGSTFAKNVALGAAGGVSVRGGPGGAGSDGTGGGILAEGDIRVERSTLWANVASGGAGGKGGDGTRADAFGGDGGAGGSARGGGLHTNGDANLANLTFAANAVHGGAGAGGGRGILARGTSGSTTAGVGGTGGAGGSGAGAGLYAGGGTVTLLSSTFSANAAGKGAGGAGGGGPERGERGAAGASQGGGIAGSITIGNTISARNTAEAGPDFFGTGSAASGNLLGNGDGSTGVAAANGNLVGTTAAPIDPKLGKLAMNGGPTATYALLPGSPARDAGDDTTSPGATDQRGAARAVDGIDIGAVEFQADRSLTATASVASVKVGGMITYSLTVTNLGPDSASLLVLTSAVPTGATFVSLTAPRGWAKTTPTGATGTITATLPALTKGGRARLTLVVRVGSGVTAGASIDFTATIGSALDPVAGNNAVNLSVPVVA